MASNINQHFKINKIAQLAKDKKFRYKRHHTYIFRLISTRVVLRNFKNKLEYVSKLLNSALQIPDNLKSL